MKDRRLTSPVIVHLTAAEAKTLRERAEREARSLSNMVRRLLLRALDVEVRPERRA